MNASIVMRKSTTAVFLLVVFCTQLICTPLMALTSGPSQPESQSFQPAGASEMVDLFSGDFSYNIPLFELPGPNGGYPFNLSYQSGITMDQEASWTGLGWSLNPGAINRQVRGLPDEFKGENIYTKTSINPSITIGLGAGAGIELFGKDKSLSQGSSLTFGFGAYYNNYKGIGYSIDGTLGLQKATGSRNSFGLSVNMDSKEGVGVSPSLSLSGKTGDFGLGVGYNSKSGLSSISLSYDTKEKMDMYKLKSKDKDKNKDDFQAGGNLSMGATLSLASPGYTPQITMPMRNVSVSASFKAGGAWWGVFGNLYVRGFYNEQWLKDNRKRIQTKGYGYLNYQHSTSNTDILDFNREKDGMVTKESPNLSIPSFTYDIYSVTGQGIGAMYRPFRNDYGFIHDQEVSSISVSTGVGVDAAPAASHGGLNLSVNHSKSTSGPWTSNAPLTATSVFLDKVKNDLYEPWYFKVHGEPFTENVDRLNNLGGDHAVRVKLENTGDGNANVVARAQLESNAGWTGTTPNSNTDNRDRKPRNQNIQMLTNEQILNGGQEIIPLYNIDYIDYSGNEKPYERTTPGHHTAGLTAVTPDGLRYVYALPAYNKIQEEVVFSALRSGDDGFVNTTKNGLDGSKNEPDYDYPGTDKYLKKTEIPQYAHSYLLTAIVGPDYVDRLGDGVTKDDLGYWVKLTYKQTTTPTSFYKWRDPFIKAHFIEGWKTDPRDDKGQYTYGEKELWYLAKAETSTHIATFQISAREDGHGVDRRIKNENIKTTAGLGASVYRLDEIKLFTRFEEERGSLEHRAIVPIKTIVFKYDYSLCGNIYNNHNGGGKLTLTSLFFKYGASNKGELNPYEFAYNQGHDYSLYANDRWGTYKPFPSGRPIYNSDAPYALQDPAQKEAIDDNAASWSLKQIRLPSGGEITVDYETDDYAYVQHRVASQMTPLLNPDPNLSKAEDTKFDLTDSNLKVRFKLEKEIPKTTELNEKAQRKEVLKYLDEVRKQLYFKIKVNLRTPSEGFYEYISGYADIDFNKADGMGLELKNQGDSNYTYGYFYLVPIDGRNPMSMRAWQHLRTNQPELTSSGRKLDQTNNASERISQIKSMGSVITQVRTMFQGIYKYCADKGWGREVVANESWIRLLSVDKIKYGGGLRVRQVTIKDKWAQDEEGIYGQVYEYTTNDENGQLISSGVAAYEPLAGGDENTLRYAKKFTQSVPLRSDNNLFFEYPINETYYPGPQVGYSKVSVMSLASASKAGKVVKNITLSNNKKLFPTDVNNSIGTTGMTVHEFYTAKDFPVITSETDKVNKPYKLAVAVPFLGSVTISKLAASQGYSVITNDMHGKSKQTTNYRQDREGKINPDPVSWVLYNYRQNKKVLDQQNVFTLDNVLVDNSDGTLSIPASDNSSAQKVYFGQESEFMMDMREFEDNTWGGGANFNIDINYVPVIFGVIPIPVPTAWPNVNKTTDQLRTVVTNKVIFRSGILASTEVYNEGSKVITHNLKWDKLTGGAVLTSVNNNFDAPVFSYSLPAYSQYPGMGAAFQNTGLVFDISAVVKTPYQEKQYEFNSSVNTLLFPGDELLIYPATDNGNTPVAKAIYTGIQGTKNTLVSDANLTKLKYKCLIIRSGHRNQLSVQAGSITALEDPSKQGPVSTFNRTIKIPK